MIIEIFEEQVKRNGDRVAVKVEGTVLVYRELNRYANAIGRMIGYQECTAGEAVVGLLFEHGVDMIAAILGALKAGKIYVPLSVDYPENRLQYMLTNSNATMILTNRLNRELAEHLARQTGIGCLVIDGARQMPDPGNPAREIKTDRLAYIMYTSGSTGRPKGVMQTHRNVIYYTRNWGEFFSIGPEDRMTLFSSFCHDGSVQDMFSALHNGATLYPFFLRSRQAGASLSGFLRQEQITIWHSVPSLFSYFAGTLAASEQFPGIRYILLGGEEVREHEVGLFKKYFPGGVLANVYGQTESSVDSIRLIRHEDPFDKSLLGKPLDETQLFIVDKNNKEAAPLQVGEILVASRYITPGYWQNPTAGQKAFADDEEMGRLYWTGDLGRLLLNGDIEFMGRADNQVKIRGFRIELGEIESQLLRYPGIREAVVLAFDGEDQADKYLCAYFVAEEPVETATLRGFLAGEVPDYMVPAFFMPLARMPLTQSNKIDRRALPKPGRLNPKEYEAPRDELEERLVKIWQQVLGFERVGIADNFFELGGHSLSAVSLVSRIHEALHVVVPMREIFDNPRVKALAGYIRGSEKVAYMAIPAAEKQEYYPLSSAQKRLIILQELDKESTAYNMTLAVELTGKIELTRLKEVFGQLLARHESLRTFFEMSDNGPVQRVLERVAFELEVFRTGGRSGRGGQSGQEPIEHIIKEFIRPFALSRAPLLRAGLIVLSEERHILLADVHHIVSDGLSQGILARDFLYLYNGEKLPVLDVQYKDYAGWDNSRSRQEARERQKKYWLLAMSGELPVLDLPLDYARPAMQSFAGGRMFFRLAGNDLSGLRELCRQEGVTLFMVLLAVYTILLAKLSGQEDILVGVPVAGRKQGELSNVVGVFINTLAMRNYPQGEQSFREFLHGLKENTIGAFENQEYPFEELVEALAVRRDLGRNPVFDVLFRLQNFEVESGLLPAEESERMGLKMKPYAYERGSSQFDLNLACEEGGDDLLFWVEYCTALFKGETVKRYMDYFRRLVGEVKRDGGIKLKEMEMVSAEERGQVVRIFNDTAFAYEREKRVEELFAGEVEKGPDRIAIVGANNGSSGQYSLTFSELDRRAAALAGNLIEQGVLPNTVVALQVGRSIDMIIGLLGILKAGAAYLPIDPEFPGERIEYMLADSRAEIVIGSQTVGANCCSPIQDIGAECRGERQFAPTDLAYVIYTSGSTGRPKGVMIGNRALVNFIFAMTRLIGFNDRDVILSLTTISFDIFGLETLVPLCRGARVAIGGQAEQVDSLQAARLLQREQANILQVTPSRLSLFLASGAGVAALRGLRCLLVGGEAFTPVLLDKVRSLYAGRIYNMYGPTETTIWSTVRELTGEAALNIGQPIGNTVVYVLDRYGQVQPLAVKGEIYIGGAGLARGYLNNPELTAERFVGEEIPAGVQLSPRLYKTGDLGRWLPDGNLECLGRVDFQVKIRGYRIELGEIEAHLQQHEGVREAVVLVEGEAENKYLRAYLATAADLDVGGLREFLAGKMPEYMIPSMFTRVEAMPLTPAGKVDRKKLQKLGGERLGLGVAYQAPRDELEERLVAIWQEVLGVERVGIGDNFFELGGHSLNAVTMLSKVHESFAVEVPLREMFNNPRPNALAGYIRDREKTAYRFIPMTRKQEVYALSSAQKRLYILQELDKHGTGYNLPLVLELEGKVDPGRVKGVFMQLLARHESLRTFFEMSDNGPVQRVLERVAFELEVFRADGRSGRGPERGESLAPDQQLTIIKEFIRPFALSQAPLLRAGLIVLSEERHILLADVHHIVSDGLSQGILARDFLNLYIGEELPPLPVQYRDYAEWENSRERQEVKAKQEGFWQRALSGELPVLDLPLDYERPAVQSFAGGRIFSRLGAQELEGLKKLGRRQGATLFMVVLGLYQVWLAKLSGQEDILVGVPVAGRKQGELSNVVGVFINTLVMRGKPVGEKLLGTYLEEVKEWALGAFENQEYPFEELVEALAVRRDLGRNPVFDVLFRLQNYEIGEGGIPEVGIGRMGLKMKPYAYERGSSQFDLNLACEENGGELVFWIEYCSALFKRETVKRYMGYFRQLVGQAIGEEAVKIKDIEMMDAEERRAVMEGLNKTEMAYTSEKRVEELFAGEVEKGPDRIAIVGANNGSSGQYSLTYSELDRRASALAGNLIEQGVLPNTVVALQVGRSIDMIIGLLGILKAGAAYLPIDPEFPGERIEYMLADSGAEIVIGSQTVGANNDSPPLDVGAITLTPNPSPTEGRGAGRGERQFAPTDLAYVIYTSGSTGRPKGVMIGNRALVNFIFAMTRLIGFNDRDVILSLTTISFDIFGLETLVPLCRGARVAIGGQAEQVDSLQAARLLQREQANILQVTPSRLSLFLASGAGVAALRGLRCLLVGGEAFTPVLLDKVRSLYAGRIYNMYGPTETTIWSTVRELTGEAALNIGQPIGNTVVYVLDRYGQVQPLAVKGEIYIGGAGLARGYLNNPELTAERFVGEEIPAGVQLSPRLYKTGDLGRWLPDGNLECLGRVDFQVKIRGYRIELGEIEAHLQQHEGVREAVVLVEGEAENKYLRAYLATAADLDVGHLHEYLGKKVPGYMIPSEFIRVEALPLTANGKVDRQALRQIPGERLRPEVTYVSPGSELEIKVAEAWKEVLQLASVGIYDNFFALGGNSLRLIRLNQRLGEVLGQEIPVVAMFKYMTISSFVAYLAMTEEEAVKSRVEQTKSLVRSKQLYRTAINQFKRGGKHV